MSSPTPQLEGKPKRAKLEGKTKLRDSHLLRERTPGSHWDRYIQATKLGMTKEDSADFAGVSSSVIRLWRANAEEDEEEGIESTFTEFFAAIRSARAQMLSRNLATVEKARQTGDWKAASWLLERHGYSKQVEVSGTVGATLTYTIDNQDLEA